MNSSGGAQTAIFAGVGLIVLLFILAVSLACYVFYSYCFMRICKKTGHEPGALVWIPIVQIIPLLQVAGWPAWYLLLMFVPLVNVVASIWMWVRICEARGKSGWMVLLLFVPVVNLAFVPYLHSRNRGQAAGEASVPPVLPKRVKESPPFTVCLMLFNSGALV